MPPSGIDFSTPERSADALEWVLSGLFSQTPSWFWDRGGCESSMLCRVRGNCFAVFGYIVLVFGTRLGVSGMVTE